MSRNPKNKHREAVPIPPPAPLPEPEEIDVESIFNDYVSGVCDLIVVLGPTASGKTRYAVNLAHRLDDLAAKRQAKGSGSDPPVAEIISADSRQIYKGMDIGTGKDLDDYGNVPYHLIDIAPAGSRFDLYQWQQAFELAYRRIREEGGIPILCGGTGLYIQAATCGFTLPQVPPDPKLRANLESADIEDLREKLAELRPIGEDGDPYSVPASVMQSKRRLIRALEVAFYENGHPAQRSAFLPKKPYCIGTLVDREERNARIDKRLDERLREGMVEEVKRLLGEGIRAEDLMYYGLEYKYVTQYVLSILTDNEMKVLLANAIHQFAKRQMTWFRGMERKGFVIHWTFV